MDVRDKYITRNNGVNILFFRHPFLLYPYFIDRWKKGLEENCDSLNDDDQLEDMFKGDNELQSVFIDDEENAVS